MCVCFCMFVCRHVTVLVFVGIILFYPFSSVVLKSTLLISIFKRKWTEVHLISPRINEMRYGWLDFKCNVSRV